MIACISRSMAAWINPCPVTKQMRKTAIKIYRILAGNPASNPTIAPMTAQYVKNTIILLTLA